MDHHGSVWSGSLWFTLLSLWLHFELTLRSLWFHFDSLGFYFDIILISHWFHSLSQGFHIEFNLNSLWSHFDFTLFSLWIHFEFTLDFAKSSLWFHFRSQGKMDSPWQQRGKGKASRAEREGKKSAWPFGLIPTRQWTPFPLGNGHRTYARTNETKRFPGKGLPPNFRYGIYKE